MFEQQQSIYIRQQSIYIRFLENLISRDMITDTQGPNFFFSVFLFGNALG